MHFKKRNKKISKLIYFYICNEKYSKYFVAEWRMNREVIVSEIN